MSLEVPAERRRSLNQCALRRDGEFVLYWMSAQRRVNWNFALDRAVELACDLSKPLVVFEPLRVGHEWASARFHRFILDGMASNQHRLAAAPCTYFPYVEPERGAAKGLLAALGERACAVVADDYPAFFLPKILAAAASRLSVALEAVDSNGLYPMHDTERVFSTAHSFRAHLQKQLKPHLASMPEAWAFAGVELPTLEGLPEAIVERWPEASAGLLKGESAALRALPIDHEVAPVDTVRGGAESGERLAQVFVSERLERYDEDRNQPEIDGASGLSPYLHFGHVSAHQVFTLVAQTQKGFHPGDLPDKGGGARTGWWGMSAAAEAFLDELVTWRELGFNMASHWGEHYERYESLPEWARATLEEHSADERKFVYSLSEFEAASTHDELWNAAQRQLMREGKIHNYLRMLWGKKILEWSATPRDAHAVMVELNNKYALDGRDPNSYSGIMWVLGRYDRAWGPERQIFGKVRYMSSENTARKVRVKSYISRYGHSLFS